MPPADVTCPTARSRSATDRYESHVAGPAVCPLALDDAARELAARPRDDVRVPAAGRLLELPAEERGVELLGGGHVVGDEVVPDEPPNGVVRGRDRRRAGAAFPLAQAVTAATAASVPTTIQPVALIISLHAARAGSCGTHDVRFICPSGIAMRKTLSRQVTCARFTDPGLGRTRATESARSTARGGRRIGTTRACGRTRPGPSPSSGRNRPRTCARPPPRRPGPRRPR